ncbi:MAG: TfuA-related McrA-glycine thioamidation protein [Methanomicrobiales archaeon]|nr:TfuA-related McrA-glycine thioamidation protein [Methanomicrobiales archaeon]
MIDAGMPAVVIFLGPSLPVEEARCILEATYLPPAKRGDVEWAVNDGARVIGLIDGVFFQECAVAHREILFALRRGVRVIGASSMGALRSAELDIFGMEGVGVIYRLFSEGLLESDDEVALVFDPLSGKALSEPLVNIRATLALSLERGVISSEEHHTLLDIASALYYPDRTYQRICREAADRIERRTIERFQGFISGEAVDLKKKDAIAALEYIRDRVMPDVK